MTLAGLLRMRRLAAAFAWSAGLASLGQAATVQRINLETGAQGGRVTLEFDQLPRYKITNQIRDKGYCFIDVYDLTKSYARTTRDTPADAALKTVDFVNYPDFGVLRVVLYARGADVQVNVAEKTGPAGLVVTAQPASASGPPTGPPAVGQQQPVELAPGPAAFAPPKAQLDAPGASAATAGFGGFGIPSAPPPRVGSGAGRKKTVVIDPGHGGHDTGANSRALVAGQKALEKDLTLLFANELKKIIDTSGNMQAVVTRFDDRYVPLYDRARQAEGTGADFFISIHMNDGGGNDSARGFEIYYLNEKGASTGAAKAIEDRENREYGADSRPKGSSILRGILTDVEKGELEKWKYESYVGCRYIENSLVNGLQAFRDHNRGIKNANFVVLKNFAMPALLFEVGFITNTDDLRLLVDPAFQQATALMLYNGIVNYFQQADPGFRPVRFRIGQRAGGKP